MAETASYLLLGLILLNPFLMLGGILICRWYWRQCQACREAIEDLIDEEVSHG